MGLEFTFKVWVSGWLPDQRKGWYHLEAYVWDTEPLLLSRHSGCHQFPQLRAGPNWVFSALLTCFLAESFCPKVQAWNLSWCMSLTCYKRCHWETRATVTKSIANHKIRCVSTQKDNSLLLRLKFSDTSETLKFQGPEGPKQVQMRKYRWGLFCSHGHCGLLTSLKTLSARAWGQACEEGTTGGRQRPEMPVSLCLEEGRCHQSQECGQRTGRKMEKLGSRARGQQVWTSRSEGNKALAVRESGTP